MELPKRHENNTEGFLKKLYKRFEEKLLTLQFPHIENILVCCTYGDILQSIAVPVLSIYSSIYRSFLSNYSLSLYLYY